MYFMRTALTLAFLAHGKDRIVLVVDSGWEGGGHTRASANITIPRFRFLLMQGYLLAFFVDILLALLYHFIEVGYVFLVGVNLGFGLFACGSVQ
jgi:hypothetical protein